MQLFKKSVEKASLVAHGEDPPASAGDADSTPDPGRSHMSWSI